MERLVTGAGPSPESIDRLKAAILSMAAPPGVDPVNRVQTG
jgi:hypothetical protein